VPLIFVNERSVSFHCIGIRYYCVAVLHRSIHQFHTARLFIFDQYFFDFRACAYLYFQFFAKAHERARQIVHSALHIPRAKPEFDVGNKRKRRGRTVRRRAVVGGEAIE
jgi:hypothetical protein